MSGESSVQLETNADPLRPRDVDAPDSSLATPIAKVIDMTGADSDEESGVQDRDGFLSVVSRRGDDALWPAPFLPQCRLFQSISPSIAKIEAVESQGPEFGDA